MVAETLFAAAVKVSVISNETSSLANLCCIQARDMPGGELGQVGKSESDDIFCLWLTGMKAKELMIKGTSFSFPRSNGKVKIMVT